MRKDQLILDLADELFVVGFAGGGGSCTGYHLATGRNVDLACNHDELALAMHRANHPQTRHFPEDIRRWDLARHVAGRRVGGAWYSPDCKHFSKAKGGKPKDKFIRGLAWVIIHEINQLGPLAPRVIFLENVEEFLTWGPLDKQGNIHKGWRAWFMRCFVGALKRRGFHDVEPRILRACDYGAPTIRKRLYLIARRDGRPIVWPEATHARPHSKRPATGPRGDRGRGAALKPWRTFAECADWSLPCPSIFLTKAQGRKVNCKRPLVKATRARLAKGVDRHVLKAKRPFLVNLTHQGGDRTESVDAPMMTITGAQRGEKALVAPFVAHLQHGGATRPADAPLHTVAASRKDCNVAAVAKLAAPFTVPRYGEREGQEPRSRAVNAPGPTIVATGNGANLGVAFVARQFGTSVGHEAQEPLKTVMSDGGGGKNQAAVAFIAQHNGGMVGHQMDKPLSTLTGKCSQQQIVGATIAAYYGNEEDGQGVHEPLRTTTTKERFGLGECFGAVPPFTKEMEAGARRVAKFLRQHGVEFEGEFATVMVRGVAFVIVDIGMRMLTPRELFRAQGFPDDYVIDRGVVLHIHTGQRMVIKLTKTAQIRMCGNSVSPPVAAALIAANLPEMSLHAERMVA